MSKWIVIEVKDDGSQRALDGLYDEWADACEVQEAMEWIHDENSYLIYSADSWVYECENGRA